LVACGEIFGEMAFRKEQKTKRKPPVNKALFEAWCFQIGKLSDEEIEKLKQKKEVLIEKFYENADRDSEFFKSISQASQKISYRYAKIEEIIKEVLND
jgi:hypothetical protein